MNKLLNSIAIFLIALVAFTSCNNEGEDLFPSELIKGAYIVNYGNYGEGGASISKFNFNDNVLSNMYYQTQNDGLELLSNIQYACEYNDSIYLMGNNSDEIIIVNPLFQQSENGITTGIAKPRYCVGEGDYLYISCLGENPDFSIMPDTYIAKFNTKTKTVDGKIDLPGGPEGLSIANGKLYAALNYVDSVAVINLGDNKVSYIATPAVSSYFIKDDKENLYVSLVNTWSDPSTETGLGYINTTSNSFDEIFKLDGVSSDYGSIISANSDFSKIYVLASQYDENWNLSGSVFTFDVANGTFSEFITGISGPKGVTVNPVDNKIYLFIGESVTAGGLMKIYAEDGTLENEFSTGISPNMALFLE